MSQNSYQYFKIFCRKIIYPIHVYPIKNKSSYKCILSRQSSITWHIQISTKLLFRRVRNSTLALGQLSGTVLIILKKMVFELVVPFNELAFVVNTLFKFQFKCKMQKQQVESNAYVVKIIREVQVKTRFHFFENEGKQQAHFLC